MTTWTQSHSTEPEAKETMTAPTVNNNKEAAHNEELEYLYSPSRWSHRMGPTEVTYSHVETLTKGSQDSNWVLDCETDISYGDTANQKMDVFHKKGAPKKGCPIFVYFHGGYWQIPELHRQNSSFMAVPLCNAGATVIAVGYDLCPDVTVATIVSQIEKAVHFIIKLAKERQSRGVYLCGHSAGGHLAAMMLKSSFSEYDAFDPEMIKGAVLVSGVFDLRPLVKTTNNDALKMTEQEAESVSPLFHINEISSHSLHRHVIVAVGEYDSPEFRRQSGEMEKSLRDHGVKANYVDVQDVDHFNIIEKLVNPQYTLTKECIRLMGL